MPCEHVKADLEARVRSFPPSYLLAPIAGEIFDNVELCKERLQGWALSQGFAIVPPSILPSSHYAAAASNGLCVSHTYSILPNSHAYTTSKSPCSSHPHTILLEGQIRVMKCSDLLQIWST